MMRGELIGLVERGDDWESKTAAEVGRQSRALAEWIGCEAKPGAGRVEAGAAAGWIGTLVGWLGYRIPYSIPRVQYRATIYI